MRTTSVSMDIIDEGKVVIQSLLPAWYEGKAAGIDMLRLDLIHPVISGNKWYKLRNNLRDALAARYEAVLSFGGAYSNHLVATAAAAHACGLRSVGLVRGLHAQEQLTPALEACRGFGMELVFISREEYGKKAEVAWLERLAQDYPGTFIIPEGGANRQGREGAAAIAGFISPGYTHVCLAVGTGTTLEGIRNALPAEQELLGFVPMKDGGYLKEQISGHLVPDRDAHWRLFDKWHFGGFGKWSEELIAFMNEFYRLHQVPLDIVYTAKMMYGVQKLLQEGYFDSDARILCIHSGGLQGNASVQPHLEF